MAAEHDGRKPRHMTHEEFARQQALKLIRRNPPPVRPPDQTQLPSPSQPAAEVDVDAHDKQGNPRKIVVRANLPSHRAVPHYQRHQERDETGLMVAAVISFFVPCGFLLALWPAFSAKGPARTVAVISLALHIAVILVYVTVAMNRGGAPEL